ncbi:hypothetical protein OH77DRAFT_1412230 [Trametes cingulata]|nr:hypothetical protein OH77DRAFT_1412230 [Trametes cingulata]
MTRLSPLAPDYLATSERPTLPSLASLQLPDISSRRSSMDSTTSSSSSNASNANELLPPIPLDFNRHWARPRQSSVSSESSDSSTTSTSTASSSRPRPTGRAFLGLPREGILQLMREYPSFHPVKHRLVLSDRYDTADCMLLLPLQNPDEKALRRREMFKRTGIDLAHPHFIFGRYARRLRHPQIRCLYPARVYPYRLLARTPAEVVSYRLRRAARERMHAARAAGVGARRP